MEKFGEWTALYVGPRNNGRERYYCKCSCGNECLVNYQNLISGKSKGCIKCSAKRKKGFHGMSKSKTYSVYLQMIERCHNPSHKYYSYYGERGIYVCDRWKKNFKNFLEDMGESPENLSLDRIDNEKGYSKDNCKWSTKKEQQRNRRNSINIGEIHNYWQIVSRSNKKKTYVAECMCCRFKREVASCNFRRMDIHNCTYGAI